ncbi:IQ motif and S7 domain-containing protein 1 [Sparganum proliferum]
MCRVSHARAKRSANELGFTQKMCSRQPSLSAARVVSLSTEHLNHGVFGRDPNNFAHVSDEPCPCQNHIRLQQHTSHWQYAGRSPQSRRKTTSSAAPAAVRSDSATAVPRDPSGDVYPQQKPSLCDSLHALTILKPTSSRCPSGMRDFDHLPFVPCSSATTVRTGGSGTKPYSVTTASRYQSAAYELSDDLRAKEVEFIERTYGGRLRAQHAARVIQAKYRDYRMRAQYDRLRSSRRPPRQHDDLGSSTTFCSNDLPLSREHLASMEDLVLDRAYLDWESEVANGSIVDLTATQSNRASAPSACVADRGQNDEAVLANATVVPTTATASCSSLVTTARHPQHCHQFSSASASSGSPGTATGSTSGFVSSPGSCSSSGSLSNEPPKTGTVATTGDPSASYTDIAATASPMPPPRQQQHTRTLSNPPPALATAAAAAAAAAAATASSPASSKTSLKSHVQQLVPVSHAVDDVVRHHQQFSQSSLEQSPCAYYLLDNLVTTERTPASSQVYVAVPLNQEPLSSQQQQQQQYHQQNQRDNYKYLRVVCPAGQTLPAAPVLAQPAVLVRRSSLGSNSSNTPPSSAPTRPTTSSAAAATPIWCTPDGKMYTLAYAPTSTAASTGVGAPTESRIALVPQAVNSVGEPRRVVHSQSLNHSQSAQQQQHQVLLVRRQACDNTNHPHRVLHTTAVSSTPVQRCQVVKPLVASVDIMREGSAAALQQQQHQPILVKVHPPGLVAASPAAPTTSATARESPASADRSRKRVYRVCLNYFNKSPVKGINMLIKYRFLETSPRQIARFLLTRRGLSRSAIGEYLGEMKDDLAKATTRQFMRELDFRDKDVDEALRTLMSRFRTPISGCFPTVLVTVVPLRIQGLMTEISEVRIFTKVSSRLNHFTRDSVPALRSAVVRWSLIFVSTEGASEGDFCLCQGGEAVGDNQTKVHNGDGP